MREMPDGKSLGSDMMADAGRESLDAAAAECPYGLKAGVLRGCRALDLSDDKGQLCGKILADFGADVIKVEPSGGDKVRNIGPFSKDASGGQISLHWLAYNVNKKSITLDVFTADGQSILKKLSQTADFIIESFTPGTLDGIGLGYKHLSQSNARLIMVSITPFGQTGPYREYLICDLVAMAMGGHLFLTGNPERPPVRMGIPQAYLHAGAEGAVGAMIAYFAREKDGVGQHVDVSIQQSVVMTTLNAVPNWVLEKVLLGRQGTQRSIVGGLVLPQTWKCQDGYVTFTIFGGASGERSMSALVRWMDEEGMAPDDIKCIDWGPLDFVNLTQAVVNRIVEPIKEFFLTHTKVELYTGSVERGIMLLPVSGAEDLANNPQFADRGFWQPVVHEGLAEAILYPGDAFKAQTLLRGNSKRAPRTGEHNMEIYMNELGMSYEELVALKQSAVI